MVRVQQKPVLRSRMAAWRVGNPGGSELQLVNPETLKTCCNYILNPGATSISFGWQLRLIKLRDLLPAAGS